MKILQNTGFQSKIYVKVTEINGAGVETPRVEMFRTEREFNFHWQESREDFKTLEDSVDVRAGIMNEAEINAFVEPFRAAVIEADRKKAEAKKIYDELKEANKNLLEVTGFGYMFQDTEGVVYEVSEPEYKTIYFEKVDILRTRREGEKKGSLSMEKARQCGFIVEGK